MSENETTNAQAQDTAARVMEAIGGIVAKLGVCHDNAKTEADAWEFRKIRTELAALLPALEHGLRTPAPASDTVSKAVALWDEMTAALRVWYPDFVTHPSNRLADKADALRPELERLLAERATLQQALARQAGKVKRLKAAIGSHPLREALARQEQATLAALAELDEMRAERDAARAECERLREELAAIRAAMLEDVARDVDGLLEQAERFRRNLIIEARFRRNPNIEAQSRAHNTEASS